MLRCDIKRNTMMLGVYNASSTTDIPGIINNINATHLISVVDLEIMYWYPFSTDVDANLKSEYWILIYIWNK